MLETFLTTIPKPDEHPTKLPGGYLGARVGTKVTIPWLDFRRCEGITIPMKHPVVDLLMEHGAGPTDPPIRDKTLAIALKTYYHGKPVFHGPLATPKYDFIAGTVDLAAQDPGGLRLVKAILNVADLAVTQGVTIDGPGMFSLLASAQNPPAHDALGWPVLGVIPGIDRSRDFDSTTQFQRLDKVWEAIKQIGESFVGPDFELEPFETDPAELASGTDTDAPGTTTIAGGAGTVTDFPLDVVRTGSIGELRLGIWATHDDPTMVDVDLVHPDGTVIRVYTGSRGAATPGPAWLGTSATLADLAKFDTGPSIYTDTYPHVGTFRSKLSQLEGKDAAGTWKLRFTAHSADTGDLDHWRLDFILPPPAYCRLNVFDKLDTDNLPAPSCTFRAGDGATNSRVFTVTPRGDLEVNQFIATSRAGGTRIPVDNAARADYGTYQEADSPGEEKSSAYLLEWGKLHVGAYSRPLPELELAPKDDSGSNDLLRYGRNFKGGSLVRAVGKDGYAYWDLFAQVREVTLTQQKSSVRTDMEVVPVGVAAGGLGDES